MAETKNWIEKCADSIAVMSRIKVYEKNIMAFKNQIAAEILSHAPVVDAEKLAEKIAEDYWIPPFEPDKLFLERKEGVKKEVAQLITDNIELDITWVAGKAFWGIFTLFCWGNENREWSWDITTGAGGYIIEEGEVLTEELAQQACESELRRIVTGGKDVG